MRNTMENVQIVSEKISDNEISSKYTTHRIEADLEYRKAQIIAKAEWLIRDLTGLVEGLNEKGVDYHFNNLGEVQGKGNELDRMLGELAAVKRVYQDLARC